MTKQKRWIIVEWVKADKKEAAERESTQEMK